MRGDRSGRRAAATLPLLAAAGLLAVLAGGCTLADVSIPDGQDVLVVEAVLRTDQARQQVLLHRGVVDGVSGGEGEATVRVRRVDGGEFVFEYAGSDCVRIRDGEAGEPPPEVRGACFRSRAADGMWVAPGATYELEVETPRGERVRGRTVVPGEFSLPSLPFTRVDDPERRAECRLAPGTTLRVHWTAAEGAWAYVTPLHVYGLPAALPPIGVEIPEVLELVGVSVSAADTSIVLPSEFGVFDRFRYPPELLILLQQGLPPGVRAELVVSAADRNYVNGVRGGSFNPSGRVRISSVVGDGVGVFGSLVTLRSTLLVEGAADGAVPPCAGA